MTRMLHTGNALLAVLFLGIFAMAARNVVDPDIWWHLKTGEYIAQHHSVPRTDPFSYTRAGAPWVAHEWLSDLLFYEVQRTMGFGGLIIIFGVVISAAFFLLYLRCGPCPTFAASTTLFAAFATAPLWGVRPQILSLLLTSLWLLILERSGKNPKLLWWTLPLTVLWVNLHAGFALGLALSALFLVGSFTESVAGTGRRTAPWRMSASILFLDLLLVSLNPNGLRLYSYPIKTLRSGEMQSYIAEWASPNFHRAEYWPFLLIVLATFAALSWSQISVGRRDLILLLVSLFASLSSIRLIPLFVLIATPLIAKRMVAWPRREFQSSGPRPVQTLLNAIIILFMALFATLHTARVIQHQPEAEAKYFPVPAVAYLQSHPSVGPLFNHYDWGGYLIWKLSPRTPVFVDGRADLYVADLYGDELDPANLDVTASTKDDNGPRIQTMLTPRQSPGTRCSYSVLQEFADLYEFKGEWRRVLKRWKIRTVLVPSDSALATGLASAPGWSVSYRDGQAVILSLNAPER